MQTIYFNGKFCAQRTTGVQRYATELLRALDAELDALPGADGRVAVPVMQLLIPPSGTPPRLANIGCRIVPGLGRSLHAWEQICLPWASRSGLLLNLAGSSALLGRQQITTLHDAAVFDRPQAYRTAFSRWYRMQFKSAARRARLLLTVSHFSQQRLSLALGVPAQRLRVVAGGADHLSAMTDADSQARLAALGLVADRYLLAVASANPNKNLALLGRAFAGLPPGHGLTLVLVGDSAPAGFAAGGLIDGPGMRRLGAVDDRLLAALYRQALALVFPSIYEGFGLPPLEAMRLGCPVVAARAASLPEVCGDAALYVETDDPAALGRLLMRLRDEPALCHRLRRAGIARAAQWPWSRSARQLLDLLMTESSR